MYIVGLEIESKQEKKCFPDISFQNKSTLELVFGGTVTVKIFCLKIPSPLLPGKPFLLGSIIAFKV